MVVAASRQRRWTAGVGGLVGHFSIQVPTVRIGAVHLVIICKSINARDGGSVALIPVVIWKDVVKPLRTSVGLVLNVILGQIRAGLHVFWKVRPGFAPFLGEDVGAAVRI